MRNAWLYRLATVFLAIMLPTSAAWAQSACPLVPMGNAPSNITISPPPSGLYNTIGLLDCVPNQFTVIDYSGSPLDITFTFPTPVKLTGFAGIVGGVAPSSSTPWDNSWAVQYFDAATSTYRWVVEDARSPATFDYVQGFKFATLGFINPITAQTFVVRATRNSGDRKVHISELRPLYAEASAQPGEDICALLGTSTRPAFCPANPPTQPLGVCSNVTLLKNKCQGAACVRLYSATCTPGSVGAPTVYFAQADVAYGTNPSGSWPLMGVHVTDNGIAVSESTTHFVNRSDVYGNVFAPKPGPTGNVEACVSWWASPSSPRQSLCTP
ncbi:hypothetical protein [Corallococcus exiguus]|uniref:Secreted protein n=1 Tax=Corallococcus exiguus TaxID=83462 RepID=A0A7X4YIU4_9BACT|nr:hypothetical protein [Corallococcus exiguus]NBC46061.1 hypothetical protein [Corallococcus exiguus]TNV56275.1 hypothetical protein FH620_30420 [Corallococcus exiguus]